MPSIYVVYVQKKLILSKHVKSLLCLILHELKKKKSLEHKFFTSTF